MYMENNQIWKKNWKNYKKQIIDKILFLVQKVIGKILIEII